MGGDIENRTLERERLIRAHNLAGSERQEPLGSAMISCRSLHQGAETIGGAEISGDCDPLPKWLQNSKTKRNKILPSGIG